MSGLRRQRGPRFGKAIRIVGYGSDAHRHLAHHITLIGVELAELQITRGRRMRYEGPRLSIKIKGGYVEFSTTGWTLNRACCIADPDHVMVNQPSDTGYV